MGCWFGLFPPQCQVSPIVGTCCGPGGIGAGDQTKQGSECETASLSVYQGLFIEPDCLPGLLFEGFQGVLSSAESWLALVWRTCL